MSERITNTIPRQPCEVCGAFPHVEGHHEDYNEPLIITWLCKTHHKKRHQQLRVERELVKVLEERR